MQPGNEAAHWAKLGIVALLPGIPCLQFVSGILQAIKTRDKGRLGNAATVLVMANQQQSQFMIAALPFLSLSLPPIHLTDALNRDPRAHVCGGHGLHPQCSGTGQE